LNNVEVKRKFDAGLIDQSEYDELIESNKLLFYGE